MGSFCAKSVCNMHVGGGQRSRVRGRQGATWFCVKSHTAAFIGLLLKGDFCTKVSIDVHFHVKLCELHSGDDHTVFFTVLFGNRLLFFNMLSLTASLMSYLSGLTFGVKRSRC